MSDSEQYNYSYEENNEENADYEENNTVKYSQVTIDVIENQAKKSWKKGFWSGVFMMLGIFFGAFVIFVGARLIMMYRSPYVNIGVFSNVKSRILDKDTLDKMNEVYGLIEKSYLDDYDKEEMHDGMIRGMVDSLDDKYSEYYSKKEFAEMLEDSSGEFEGIGAYFTQDQSTMIIKVVRPIAGSPAEKAGIQANDILVEVDGEDIVGQDLNLIVSKIKGVAGTSVHLKFAREGVDDYVEFDIVRAKVESESVSSNLVEGDDNIGYIMISSFDDNTDEQFKRNLDELKEKGIDRLIIDLRENGGGYVKSACNIVDYLVEPGKTIVSFKGKNGKEKSMMTESEDHYDDPIVVLVDGNTASSSEILTGCLKDYGLAKVVGTTTFGKGISQDVYSLDDGSGLKITTENYYTPSGENIHGIGIKPDVKVEWDYKAYVKDKSDNQLKEAVRVIKKME